MACACRSVHSSAVRSFISRQGLLRTPGNLSRFSTKDYAYWSSSTNLYLGTRTRGIHTSAARWDSAAASTAVNANVNANANTNINTNQDGSSNSATMTSQYYEVHGNRYERDDFSNVPRTILERTTRHIYLDPNHPLGLLRQKIQDTLSDFSVVQAKDPIVTVQKNFDDLGFPPDHPGRSRSDSYYLNRGNMLRTHTSAHEVEAFRDHDRWLLTADVYRRDEIDSSHYPIFHQVEGANIVPTDQVEEYFTKSSHELRQRLAHSNLVITDESKISPENPYQSHHDQKLAALIAENLKLTLNSMAWEIFGPALKATNSKEPLHIRWIDAYFPFTSPSYEVEVFWQGEWLEILGSGVVQKATLDRSGRSDCMGWAFGLGLERIAMILYSIPDIRLFWSTNPSFLSQFKQGAAFAPFKPYSKHPACYKDISFWCPSSETLFHENDFCEIIRDLAGDTVENVKVIDEFVHPKTQKKSLCYRINYRSMDKNLTNEEVNVLHQKVTDKLVSELGIEIR